MKTYTIYALRVARLLCKKGFKIVGTGINAQKPQFYIYYFEDTPEFRKALTSISHTSS